MQKLFPLKKDFKSIFIYTQIILWSFILFVCLFFVGVNYGLLGKMPDLEAIQNPKSSVSTTVYSSDFEVLGSYFTENRIEVSYDELSPYLIQGLIATEDKRFYSHSGIDLKGLFRAIIKTGLLGQDAGGGSTITQQLAKNLFHKANNRNALKRTFQKIKEWVLAAKIERTFTKDEIVNLYFNTIAFGYNSYGIKTAAFTYFYKTPKELNVQEAALLVAMLNGPSLYNPKRYPDLAKERRNLVLSRMWDAKYIDERKFKEAEQSELKLNFHNPDFREGTATYFREYVRQELKNWCDKNKKGDGTSWDIYTDGLKVYTTVDSRMQKYAEEAMKPHLAYLQDAFFKEWKGKDPWKSGMRAKPDLLNKMMRQSERYAGLKAEGKSDKEIEKIFNKKVEMTIFSYHGENGSYNVDTIMSPLDSIRYYLQIVQIGFLAVEPTTGEIKAWIGGPDITYFQLDHVKKTTKRQVGSTIKPMQYAVAIDRGDEPCTLIPYESAQFDGIDASWNPDGTGKWAEGELVPMKDGLAFSDNKITANLMKKFGPDALVQLCRNLKIESPLQAVPALCLGVSDISLTEMVGAYTAFANLGTYSRPYFIKRIEDKDGNVLAQFGEQHEEALSERTAYVTTEMMKGVVNKGTGARMRSRHGLQMPLAGKTGTTQSNADAWFIAFTPQLLAGCWVGFEQPSVHFLSTNTGQGSTAALPVVGEFMRKCYNDRSLKLSRQDFAHPSDSTMQINFDCTAIMPDTTGVQTAP